MPSSSDGRAIRFALPVGPLPAPTAHQHYLRRWAGKKRPRLRTYRAVMSGERSPVTADCHAGIRGSRG